MDIAPRIRQILLVLLKQQEPISVQKLSEQILVSKRTVQRELEYIAYILKKHGLTLTSKTGVGIWLEGTDEEKEELYAQLDNQDSVDFADKEVRRKQLILEMLKDQTPKKLYYYGNLLGVSEATVSKDMEHAAKWFDKFGIRIVRKPGYGVVLAGNEKAYRTAVREFIAQNMDTPMLRSIYGEEADDVRNIGTMQIKDTFGLLNENTLDRVATCFSSIADFRLKRLTENAYVGLMIHMTIAIERVKKKEMMEPNALLTDWLKEDDDYELALLLVNSLEEEFSIEIPDVEIAYICLHLKGSKLQQAVNPDKSELTRESREEIDSLAAEMIIAYDETLAPVLIANEEFVAALTAHLRPTLVRLYHQMPIENPLLAEIKEDYPDIYQRCEVVAKLIQHKIGIEVPESEIGFLAIHFGAAMVRLQTEKETKRVVDIGLVCASGIGISRLMSSRLERFLKERANITAYGQDDLTPYVLQKNDFFVTSIRLPHIEADILYVSPLLPQEDLIQIDAKVRKIEKTPKKRHENKDFDGQLDKINRLTSAIKEMLRKFRCIILPAEIHFEQMVSMVVEQITPYEENRTRLKNDLMKREEIATQVIPELGIVLLHARSKGVFHAECHLCRPSGGESFTEPYFQEVRAAIIILIPDDEYKQENSSMAGHISVKLAEDETFLACLKTDSEAQVKEALAKALKEYFNQFLDKI